MRAGIALGSNLGNRHAILNTAIQKLRLIQKDDSNFLLSSIIETEPVDCPLGSDNFINAVVELETFLTPLELLDQLKQWEGEADRPGKHEFHAPRTLDLDILYCGELTFDHPLLQVPHPRIRERFFVLHPLAEIRPDLRLPGWDFTAAEYLLQYRKKII